MPTFPPIKSFAAWYARQSRTVHDLVVMGAILRSHHG
jgi:hypothetical protein